MRIDKLFAGLNISAFGLSAQRKKMNAIASNIANAETTKAENGEPYKRKIVTMEAKPPQLFTRVLTSVETGLATTNSKHFKGSVDAKAIEQLPAGVQVKELEDSTEFKVVYDPTHPAADENGYVRTPNVNIVAEMVEMVNTTRAYEANVTAVNAAKTMAKDALEI